MTTYKLIPRERFIGLCHWAPRWMRWVPRRMARDTLMVYGRHTTNFESACQLVRCGNSAWIDTAIGDGFYDVLVGEGLAPFRVQGLRYIRSAVTEKHFRLIRAKTRRLVNVRQVGTLHVASFELVLIEFTEKKGHGDAGD